MGGKALKNTITERKDTSEFIRISNEISKILSNYLDTEIYTTKCYHTKETHGDLDLLIKLDNKLYNKGINLVNMVNELFKPNEIYKNANCLSFDYDKFQIDLILIPESCWGTAKVYFEYDPTGNLMGKIARKMKIKTSIDGVKIKCFHSYGDKGLYLIVYSDNDKLDEILLSRDNEAIFNYLGYDWEQYLTGFETIEEIFKWNIESTYFKPNFFYMESLTQVDRKRNRKRKTYNEFIEYINTQYKDYVIEQDFIDITISDISKYFNMDLQEKLDTIISKYKLNKVVSEKFNGDILMLNFPDLKGKELGNCIHNFKSNFTDINEYKQYILDNNIKKIIEKFKEINSL